MDESRFETTVNQIYVMQATYEGLFTTKQKQNDTSSDVGERLPEIMQPVFDGLDWMEIQK